MIGELDRRITLKSPPGTTQDAGGGIVTGVNTSYSVWAKVESRNGRIITGQNQEQWQYDYKITFRYETNRPITSNYTIQYDSQQLKINSISFEDEGNRNWVVARCSVTRK